MKLHYTCKTAWTIFAFFATIVATVQAQATMPTAQTIPFSQNFDGLATNATVYPAGFQGWNTDSSPGSTYNTSAIPAGDKPLALGSASSSAGALYNYNGKIGFLNTTPLDNTIAFAFTTAGKSAIQVQYDAMTIRNPYSGSNTRINEMVLQYRVGNSTAFISLPDTAYSNNTTLENTSGGTTPQNLQTIKVTLPSECDNKSLVQIRWISRQVSGAGSRPSFAIDNISVINDITPPVTAASFPKASSILSDGFDFSNQINEIGKTYYVVVPSGSAEPSKLQLMNGQDANGNAALSAGVLTVANANQPYTATITGLTIGTAYIVYSVSEDAYQNLQLTTNSLNVSTSSTLVPSIKITTAAVAFGFQEQGFDSSAMTFTFKGSHITSNVIVTAPANFNVSKDNITFDSTVLFSAAEFLSNATPTVYVRFKPTNTLAYAGQILIESDGATSKNIAVSGKGINPYLQDFNDPEVLTNSGWTSYNEQGTNNSWSTTTTARNLNSAPGAVVMNGYSDNGASSDWFISPKLHLDSFSQFALLSFYSRKYYSGPSLKLKVSTDYDGVSSPSTATWTEIQGNFPTTTDIYTKSEFINLNAFKTSHTYVAWVYETTAGGPNNAAEWSVDDIAITNNAAFLAANPELDFEDVTVNTISTSKSFTVVAGGYGPITVAAPADYQVSLDNSTFTSSVLISESDALAGKLVYARFTPTSKSIAITGPITVTGTGLNQAKGFLKGSSLPKSETFDIVTYNLEFFGSEVIGSTGTEFGPVDDPLQIDNVAAVMNKLDADIYCVQEVSDDAAMETLLTKISINGKTFAKSISTSWSYSFNAPTADFPPQKLVVLYNTQTASVKSTKVLFKDFYDQVRAGTATLPNYPDSPSSFFSSGRLPYMVTIETNLGGVKKDISLIDLHARANSGSDINKYNMRKYDAEYLKDALDAEYPNDNLVLLGDFNDDVKTSVIAGNDSSYKKFVDDTTNYNALTLGISQQGAFSYLSSNGFLDHIIISNELTADYIPNSTAVYDPRNDISNYVNTTSDHGPVIARFNLQNTLSTKAFGTEVNYAKLYPNPTKDVVNFTLTTPTSATVTFKLYDSLGREIGTDKAINANASKQASVSLSTVPAGTYFYTLTSANKIVQKGKLIKE
ncbi:endonuclease [Flavobacterium faecale]|uniref:Endonuclease n=1 Tax=Flavobacterium faecale TaxID=1355330 RepID=A0A2S1LH81_9FLAO|nr:T9SS type A sorting domain-containing protein [Flavobacterium faecale]AWG23087.1 endonuclease [Flavobacterium faecale]